MTNIATNPSGTITLGQSDCVCLLRCKAALAPGCIHNSRNIASAPSTRFSRVDMMIPWVMMELFGHSNKPAASGAWLSGKS